MTMSTYSDADRMQRRTTHQQRLAVAIALVGLVAVSGTTLEHVGQIKANVSEQTRIQQPAPEYVIVPGRPY